MPTWQRGMSANVQRRPEGQIPAAPMEHEPARTSAQLEGRDAEDTFVHEHHRGVIVLRGVEKQRATRGEACQVRVEGIGRQGVIAEQGADLAAFPTAPYHAESAQPSLAPATQGERIGLGYPLSQEGRA